MKIGILTGDIPSTSFINNLINGLADQNIEVGVYGKKKGKIDYHKNTTAYCFPASRISLLIKLLLEFFKFLLRFHKVKSIRSLRTDGSFTQQINFLCQALVVINSKPDIFHIQWVKYSQDWLCLQQFNIKVVASFRGAHINYSPIADEKLASVYKNTLPLYDAFHSVSTALINESIKYGVDPLKVRRITGAVSEDWLVEESDLKSWQRGEVLSILSIGRSHWKKGYNYALDACSLLKESGVNFIYTIVGVVNDEELLYQVNDLNLKENVKLIDRVPYSQVKELYKQTNIFLLPSVEEGIANVVLEAMAQGVLVVSTDCGGMTEVIENEKNGFIVSQRNSVGIAEIIKAIEGGEYNIDAMRKNALETIRKDFLQKDQIKHFTNFYHWVNNDLE